MKKRIAKKQITKLIGYTAFGDPVYNHVSNPNYGGGTAMKDCGEEDCFIFEIDYIRKRHGAPLLLRSRWSKIYNKFVNKIYRDDW